MSTFRSSNIVHLTVHDADGLPEAALVGAGLDATNAAVAALRNVRPLVVFAREQAETVVGGALGRTWGECCELRQLWVAESHRRCGLGTRLVREVERHARERGCRLLYLETFSFQAKPFYEKIGYQVTAEIKGFEDGIVKYLMMRDLRSE
ncbi:MAG: GNAT family N-acetyltransferase [Burkholderiaceae bacterium]